MNNEWRDLPSMADVAAAQAAGDEIEYKNAMTSWNTWNEEWWNDDAKFRARPAQPKMKKVTLCKWYCTHSGATETRFADITMGIGWKRLPEEDKIIEVME